MQSSFVVSDDQLTNCYLRNFRTTRGQATADHKACFIQVSADSGLINLAKVGNSGWKIAVKLRRVVCVISQNDSWKFADESKAHAEMAGVRIVSLVSSVSDSVLLLDLRFELHVSQWSTVWCYVIRNIYNHLCCSGGQFQTGYAYLLLDLVSACFIPHYHCRLLRNVSLLFCLRLELVSNNFVLRIFLSSIGAIFQVHFFKCYFMYSGKYARILWCSFNSSWVLWSMIYWWIICLYFFWIIYSTTTNDYSPWGAFITVWGYPIFWLLLIFVISLSLLPDFVVKSINDTNSYEGRRRLFFSVSVNL